MSAHAVERTTISEPQQAPMIQGGAPGQAWKRVRVASATLARSWTAVLLLIGVCAWGALFTNLSVTRHQALGSHAEDLGFTDQVIWNFLRGAWFQMTVYQGASWNIELDMSTVRRPNSLNSFHVEPMLLLFAPVYAAGGRPEHLLAIQAIGVALGAIPAYRLACHLTELRLAGFAIGAAWLLSPLGQWAVLSDFHTTALAAPLLMFAAERFATGHARTAFVAAILAASAREDAAVAAAALGCVIALSGRWRAGLMLATLGTLGAACALMTMKAYSGGESSPFIVRYGAVLSGPTTMLEALRQPAVTEYLVTLVLSGAWLSVLAPISFAPALPLLAMNVFSNSPWMASGKAHYSILVLPFLVTAAATTLGALTRVCTPSTFRGLHLVPRLASIALLAGAGAGYLQAGSGPFAANASPAVVTSHALTARAVAASIPQRARVSSTASIYPHLSQRASSYVFPAVEDAEYVLLDVAGSPAPTSAGDVFLRVRSMLESGEWAVELARDGVILLQRIDAEPTRAEACAALSCIPMEFYSFTRLGKSTESPPVIQSFIDGQLELLTATIMPSSNGAVEPDGPRGILRTVWQTQSALPEWVWPELTLSLNDGSSLIRDDLAALWWYPPERWQPGELIQLDIPGVPMRQHAGWSAQVPTPASQKLAFGELTVEIAAEPWRLKLLSSAGEILWEEAPGETVGFQSVDGIWRRARRLQSLQVLPDGSARMIAATDDPDGRTIELTVRSITVRSARFTVGVSDQQGVQRIGGTLIAAADERFVGLGERFTGVNQRGKQVDIWAEDRILAGHGESTYAPIPLLISNRGHSFLLERGERARFDLAATQPDRWSWTQQTSQAHLVMSYGASLKELVQQHALLTGLPPLPPIWAFGVIKTSLGGQESVLEEMQRLRELDVPVSAVYAYDAVDYEANIGWPYVNYAGRTSGNYPDHAGFTNQLHHLGFKALTYFKADFHLDRPGWEIPAERGYLVKGPDGQPLQHDRFPVTWLDFTNSAAVDWWRGLWQRALGDLGYDGGMLDVGEILPTEALLADGTTGAQTHNRYPLLYAQHAWQHASSVRPDGDFLLFARSGAAGAQQFQSLQWPGDPTMQWEAPAGLQSMIPAALSFGLSGFPYWHSEVGGYVQVGLPREQERELWLRWLQLGTWSASLRDQYGDYPLAPMDFWLDEANQTAFRDAARIHNSLIPYIYSVAAEAHRTGLPLMRFLPLEAPDDPRAWQEEQSYFFGRDLLVAPVTQPGATTRSVYLPRGQWVDFWTNQTYEGGREIVVPAPLDGGRAPAFIRAGALIPLAPEFDTLAPAAGAGIRTYSHDLIIRTTPIADETSSVTLYDGAQLTWDGTILRVANNPIARSITLRAPGSADITARVNGAAAEIRG